MQSQSLLQCECCWAEPESLLCKMLLVVRCQLLFTLHEGNGDPAHGSNCPRPGREQHPLRSWQRGNVAPLLLKAARIRSAGGLVFLLSGHLEHKSNTAHFSLNSGEMGKHKAPGRYFSFPSRTRTKHVLAPLTGVLQEAAPLASQQVAHCQGDRRTAPMTASAEQRLPSCFLLWSQRTAEEGVVHAAGQRSSSI